MAALSISRAWDETKAVIAAESRLLASVALALIVLPQAIVDLLTSNAEEWSSVALLSIFAVAGVIGFIAQIALNRLAIGPSVTVGGAISRAVARVPAFVVAFLILLFCLFVLMVIVVLILSAAGLVVAPATGHSPPPSIIALLVACTALISAIFQLTIPVAAAEPGGPIHLISRAWMLAKGNYLRLLAFVVIVLFGMLVLVLAGQFGVGTVVAALFGAPGPWNLSSLVIALTVGLIQAAFTAVTSVMLARIYLQLAGRDSGGASVPKSGI